MEGQSALSGQPSREYKIGCIMSVLLTDKIVLRRRGFRPVDLARFGCIDLWRAPSQLLRGILPCERRSTSQDSVREARIKKRLHYFGVFIQSTVQRHATFAKGARFGWSPRCESGTFVLPGNGNSLASQLQERTKNSATHPPLAYVVRNVRWSRPRYRLPTPSGFIASIEHSQIPSASSTNRSLSSNSLEHLVVQIPHFTNSYINKSDPLQFVRNRRLVPHPEMC